MSLGTFLRFALGHPVSRRDPLGTAQRVIGWQVSSRLSQGPLVRDWIAGIRLSMSRGMTAATGNLYYGLYEFPGMAFLAHLLRPGELFVDVGANVGTYSLLAAQHCRASCIAIEASSETARCLAENVRINDCADRVDVRECAAGAEAGEIAFMTGRGAMNQVVGEEFAGAAEVVKVERLDDLLAGRDPVLIKLDVEGHEGEVFKGALATLSHPSLLAIQIETTTPEMAAVLADNGFVPRWYDGFARKLHERPHSDQPGDVIFVRDIPAIMQRLKDAGPLKIGGVEL